MTETRRGLEHAWLEMALEREFGGDPLPVARREALPEEVPRRTWWTRIPLAAAVVLGLGVVLAVFSLREPNGPAMTAADRVVVVETWEELLGWLDEIERVDVTYRFAMLETGRGWRSVEVPCVTHTIEDPSAVLAALRDAADPAPGVPSEHRWCDVQLRARDGTTLSASVQGDNLQVGNVFRAVPPALQALLEPVWTDLERQAAVEFAFLGDGDDPATVPATAQHVVCQGRDAKGLEFLTRLGELESVSLFARAGDGRIAAVDETAFEVIGRCARLRHLEASDVTLTDGGLERLASARELRHLEFESIQGPGPTGSGLEAWRGRPLQTLCLLPMAGLSADGVRSLGSLETLEVARLSVAEDAVGELSAVFGRCPLRDLQLSVRGDIELASWVTPSARASATLERLQLSTGGTIDLIGVEGFSGLQSLLLAGTIAPGGLATVGGTRLRELLVFGRGGLGGSGLDLARAAALESLWLDVDDRDAGSLAPIFEACRGLRRLRKLCVSCGVLPTVEGLVELRQLAVLDVSGASLDAAQLERLREALPETRIDVR